MKKFKFIDLFAGIGGIRIPFDELGGKCVFTSEINKYSQQVYFDNHGDMPHGDITQVDIDEIPKHDLLLAGFPCQPFSQAGKQKGFSDNRGSMFFHIAEILNYHRPQAFLLENVKRFRTHDKGRTLRTVLHILHKLGYKVYNKVLSAKDFGVPQKRERIFIVGFLDKSVKFNFPDPLRIESKVGDILEKEVDEKFTISDRMWIGHQKRKEQHKKKGNGFGYSLFNEESLYTNTISARYYKDGSEALIEQKGKNPRVLTPRECARLQGFPEDFKITVSNRRAWEQFGNSVSVPVIRAIAKEMFPLFKNKNRKIEHEKIDVSKCIDEVINPSINVIQEELFSNLSGVK